MTKTKMKEKIKKLKARRQKVVKNRKELTSKINDLDAKIEEVLSSSITRGPGRPRKSKRGPKAGTKRVKNEAPLKEFIQKVMEPGVEMTAPDVSKKLKKAGFKTGTKEKQHFHSTIGNQLRKLPSVKKVGHGKYVLKPAVAISKKKSKRKRSNTKKASATA